MKQSFILCIVSGMIGAILAMSMYGYIVSPAASFAAPQREQIQQAVPTIAPQPLQVPGQFRAPNFPSLANQANDRRFTPDELVNISVYDQANPGVVNIDTRRMRERGDMFFSMVVPEEGSGSGWVLDQQGHIVTNHHVIAKSDQIEVTLSDGQSYGARVVGQDPSNDIAVLKIDAPQAALFPVPIGDSSSLKVGQKVLAIGNPFGLDRTMTTGIVSSLNRSLRSKSGQMIKNVIQLDAALNQGNSGGPLLDNAGQLIGMNTAIASSVGENTGVGFAVPANTIRRVVPELINFGKVIRPSLGIDFYKNSNVGVIVGHVVDKGPADQAGIRGLIEREVRRLGNGLVARTERLNRENVDIIVALGNDKVKTVDELEEAIEKYEPGQQVSLKLYRRGQLVEVPVTLGEED